MPELRQDPITKEWVIIATERAKRPHDFATVRKEEEVPPFLSSCPFCPGNEAQTPPEVFAYRDSGRKNSSGWRVRVVRNKYPALVRRGTVERREEGKIFRKMDGVGIHEVIIESPVHNRLIPLMEDREVEDILFAYRERYNALKKDPLIKLIIIFKNHGKSAGTSLEHPHSQLVATPVVPMHIRRRFEVATVYYDDTGRCLLCDMIREEKALGKRVVMETDKFIVFHPFASRSPFETWIAPKRHLSSFGNVPDEDIPDLAGVLKTTLLKLYKALNNPDFNYVIHTAPVDDENKNYYLWHIQIIPRLTTMAGFEIGSGIYINTALPEETAGFMRELVV
ncbi:MAG: galactose-1-phosphate uridylyltransferase [Deltaproteobacteria bacterium]|nr:MAG: galactose-1-phosphate uridylyltransferase [Deltaproteobacteria bacterium]